MSDEKITRISIGIPVALHKRLLIASAKMQIEQEERVTVANLITTAAEDFLDGYEGGDTKKSVQKVTEKATSKKKAKERLSSEMSERATEMLREGKTNDEVHEATSASPATIARKRKAIKLERAKIAEEENGKVE